MTKLLALMSLKVQLSKNQLSHTQDPTIMSTLAPAPMERIKKNAAISADIRNYTEPGEDLDWTKVSDPTERKRLQGIVGSRKYRERQLAAQGKGGSGGNYPGAAGE